MPLVANDDTKKITMPDGDWYELKTQVSWYDDTEARLSGFTMQDAVDARSSDNSTSDGDQPKALVDRSLGMAAASSQLAKLMIYIVSWSHPEPITDENVSRIPVTHGKILKEEIEALEAAQEPFRGD